MKKIFALLQDGKFSNCTTLAKELAVSVKTLRRDFEFMRDRWELHIEYHEQKFEFYFSKFARSSPSVSNNIPIPTSSLHCPGPDRS